MDPSTTAPPDNLKQRLKESYDIISPEYNQWTAEHSSLRMLYLETLLKLLHNSDNEVKVLELGCGTGIPTTEKLLTLPNFHITANDLSAAQIKTGKEILGEERVTWIEDDMMKLAFANGSFDAVLAFFSLIHLPRDEQAQMLGRISQWLKPGGFLLANFSEEDMPGQVMEKWLHEKGWMYWSGFGAKETLEKIEQAGLDVVVQKIEEESVDAKFLWVIAKKR